MDTWRAAYRGIVPDDHLENLSYEERERLWHDRLHGEDDEGCVFVAEDGGGVFGFASGRPRRDFSKGLEEYGGELEAIYVLPTGQGTGAGGRLVGAVARDLVENGVEAVLLWVFEQNGPARRFYEGLGGEVVARDGFELGGAWILEVAYGWRDAGVLIPQG